MNFENNVQPSSESSSNEITSTNPVTPLSTFLLNQNEAHKKQPFYKTPLFLFIVFVLIAIVAVIWNKKNSLKKTK